MAEYLVDEFIGETEAGTLEDEVDKNVSLLYDMYILCKKGKNKDAREQKVREMLSACQTEDQVHNTVRDAIVGKLTLNDILKRKGLLQ